VSLSARSNRLLDPLLLRIQQAAVQGHREPDTSRRQRREGPHSARQGASQARPASELRGEAAKRLLAPGVADAAGLLVKIEIAPA
jgi:hypothetical protein